MGTVVGWFVPGRENLHLQSTLGMIRAASSATTIRPMNTLPKPAPHSVQWKRWLPSLLLNVVVPFVAYAAARPFVANDTSALLIGAVIPVAATVIGLVAKRRFDPIGVASVIAFALLIGLLALTGGNPLVLKLHEAVFTGPIGLVLLASVAVQRPLASLIPPLRSSLTRPQLGVLTALVGATLVAHFVVVLVFALILPTAAFLAIGRLVGAVVLAAGLLAMRAYRIRIKRGSAVAA